MIASLLLVVSGLTCSLNTKDIVAAVNDADELRRAEQYSRARELLEQIYPCVPDGHPARGVVANNLAQIYKITGPAAAVERLLRVAMGAWRGQEEYARALTNLADWYQSQGKMGEAEVCFREAVARYPFVAVYHNNLGALLHSRRRYEPAEQNYQRALALYAKSNNPAGAQRTWGNLGLLLKQGKRDLEAIAAFQRMAEFTPQPVDEEDHGRLLEVYSALLRRQQEPAAAERVAAQAMRYRVRGAIRAASWR